MHDCFFSLHVQRSGLRHIKPLSHTRDLQRDLPVQPKRPLLGPLCTGGYYAGWRHTGRSRRTVSPVLLAEPWSVLCRLRQPPDQCEPLASGRSSCSRTTVPQSRTQTSTVPCMATACLVGDRPSLPLSVTDLYVPVAALVGMFRI